MDSSVRNPRVAVFNDTRPYGHYGCDLVMSSLISHLAERSISPTFFWPVRKDWRHYRGILPTTAEIDAIIVNGEGSIHRPVDRKRARYLSELGAFASEIGVPAYLINSTIHDIDGPTADNLKVFSRICVRENGSLETLDAFGVQASVVPDLCFSFSGTVANVRRAGTLATDSVFKSVSKRVRALAARSSWRYVPMEHKRRLLRPEMLDIDHLRRTISHWRTRREQVFLEEVAASEFVVTGRFHAAVFCLLTETPFVAIESNTPKTSALLRDVFGSSGRVATVEEVEAIGRQALMTFAPAELAALRSYRATARERISWMMDDVAASIRQSVRSP